METGVFLKGETRRGIGGGYLPGRRTRTGMQDSQLSVMMNQSDTGMRSSTLHEWVHRMEDVNPAIAEAEAAFYKKRTTLPNGWREPAVMMGPEQGFPPNTMIRNGRKKRTNAYKE